MDYSVKSFFNFFIINSLYVTILVMLADKLNHSVRQVLWMC